MSTSGARHIGCYDNLILETLLNQQQQVSEVKFLRYHQLLQKQGEAFFQLVAVSSSPTHIFWLESEDTNMASINIYKEGDSMEKGLVS